MELTASRLRSIADSARMIFGADEVEIGPGDERRVPVIIYFNREGVMPHDSRDSVRSDGRRYLVVAQKNKPLSHNTLAADGLGGRGGYAPGEMELARPLFDGEYPRSVMIQPLRIAAYIPPDFEANPWSALGRQWPHPESYLDKLRLFRSRENAGDRQVIVTVCLAADQSTPEGETDMTDKKTWRRACTCRNGATPESPGLNLGPDGVPVCKVCGKPWTLAPKPEKS